MQTAQALLFKAGTVISSTFSNKLAEFRTEPTLCHSAILGWKQLFKNTLLFWMITFFLTPSTFFAPQTSPILACFPS